MDFNISETEGSPDKNGENGITESGGGDCESDKMEIETKTNGDHSNGNGLVDNEKGDNSDKELGEQGDVKQDEEMDVEEDSPEKKSGIVHYINV